MQSLFISAILLSLLQLACCQVSVTSSQIIPPTKTFDSTWDKFPCRSSCYISTNVPRLVYWDKKVITSTITVATKQILIDDRTHITSTRLELAPLPSGIAKPTATLTAPRVTVITDNGTPTSVTFPTMVWYGTPTAYAHGLLNHRQIVASTSAKSTLSWETSTWCTKQDYTSLTLQSPLPIPLLASATVPEEDSYGEYYYPRTTLQTDRLPWTSLFPQETALAHCDDGWNLTIAESMPPYSATNLYLTITSTSTLLPSEPTLTAGLKSAFTSAQAKPSIAASATRTTQSDHALQSLYSVETCPGNCYVDEGVGFLYTWFRMRVTATLTAATVRIIIDPNNNTTITRTDYVDLPASVTIPPTAANGRRIHDLSDRPMTDRENCDLKALTRCSLKSINATMTYPENFMELPQQYYFEGRVKTTLEGGEPTCLTTNAAWFPGSATTSSLPPQSIDAKYEAADPLGWLMTVGSWELFYAQTGTDSALRSCSQTMPKAPVQAAETASLIFITETSTLDPTGFVQASISLLTSTTAAALATPSMPAVTTVASTTPSAASSTVISAMASSTTTSASFAVVTTVSVVVSSSSSSSMVNSVPTTLSVSKLPPSISSSAGLSSMSTSKIVPAVPGLMPVSTEASFAGSSAKSVADSAAKSGLASLVANPSSVSGFTSAPTTITSLFNVPSVSTWPAITSDPLNPAATRPLLSATSFDIVPAPGILGEQTSGPTSAAALVDPSGQLIKPGVSSRTGGSMLESQLPNTEIKSHPAPASKTSANAFASVNSSTQAASGVLVTSKVTSRTSDPAAIISSSWTQTAQRDSASSLTPLVLTTDVTDRSVFVGGNSHTMIPSSSVASKTLPVGQAIISGIAGPGVPNQISTTTAAVFSQPVKSTSSPVSIRTVSISNGGASIVTTPDSTIPTAGQRLPGSAASSNLHASSVIAVLLVWCIGMI